MENCESTSNSAREGSDSRMLPTREAVEADLVMCWLALLKIKECGPAVLDGMPPVDHRYTCNAVMGVERRSALLSENRPVPFRRACLLR